MQSSLVDAVYIPAERMIISLLAKVNFGIQSAGTSLPQFIIDYGAVFENARQEIKFATFPEFNLHYLFSDGRDNIKWNGSSVTLSESSTGLQSLFPLLLVIKSYSVNGPRKMNLLFTIEEPELNLYPATKKNWKTSALLSMPLRPVWKMEYCKPKKTKRNSKSRSPGIW